MLGDFDAHRAKRQFGFATQDRRQAVAVRVFLRAHRFLRAYEFSVAGEDSHGLVGKFTLRYRRRDDVYILALHMKPWPNAQRTWPSRSCSNRHASWPLSLSL